MTALPTAPPSTSALRYATPFFGPTGHPFDNNTICQCVCMCVSMAVGRLIKKFTNFSRQSSNHHCGHLIVLDFLTYCRRRGVKGERQKVKSYPEAL